MDKKGKLKVNINKRNLILLLVSTGIVFSGCLGMVPEPWKKAGFDGTEKSCGIDWECWEQAKFTPKEAKQWKENRFDLEEAKQWKENGFDLEEAKRWKKSGIISSSDAKYYKANNLSLDDILLWSENYFRMSDAVELNGMNVSIKELKELLNSKRTNAKTIHEIADEIRQYGNYKNYLTYYLIGIWKASEMEKYDAKKEAILKGIKTTYNVSADSLSMRLVYIDNYREIGVKNLDDIIKLMNNGIRADYAKDFVALGATVDEIIELKKAGVEDWESSKFKKWKKVYPSMKFKNIIAWMDITPDPHDSLVTKYKNLPVDFIKYVWDLSKVCKDGYSTDYISNVSKYAVANKCYTVAGVIKNNARYSRGLYIVPMRMVNNVPQEGEEILMELTTNNKNFIPGNIVFGIVAGQNSQGGFFTTVKEVKIEVVNSEKIASKGMPPLYLLMSITHFGH